jgi:hypothetical protein
VTVLSDEVALVYILAETGVRGKLTSGAIERVADGSLNVFDARGNPFEYLSGKRIRSWCLVNGEGKPLDGWRLILPEDAPRILGS